MSSSSLNLAAVFLMGITTLLGPNQVTAQEDPKPIARELHVPFEELPLLLHGENQRVFITRAEYEELLSKSKTKPKIASPRDFAILSSDYEIQVENGQARITGTFVVELFVDGLQVIPLELGGIGVRQAKLDNQPATLAMDRKVVLLVEGIGQHRLELEMLAPMTTSAALQSLQAQLPMAPSSRFLMMVPGNIEIKSGAVVLSREVDQEKNRTRFELIPPRGPLSLVMSLNNKALRDQRTLLARSVLVSEVTEAYERMHATVTMNVLHGAIDEFDFELPEGFEVNDATCPALARWSVTEKEGMKLLHISLREPALDRTTIQITLTNGKVALTPWKWPELKPLDVDGHASIVGVIADEKLKPTEISSSNLIAIDNDVLVAALPASILRVEPGLPKVRTVATFYSPRGEVDLQANFSTPETKNSATTNLVLVVDNSGLMVHGGFAIQADRDKIFRVEFMAPEDWQVTEVNLLGGARLETQIYPRGKERRIQVVLPKPANAGETIHLTFSAKRNSNEWLAEWTEQLFDFPRFQLLGMSTSIGAVAVQANDDLEIQPTLAENVTPLFESEKGQFRLAQVQTAVAYRTEEANWNLKLTATRTVPRTTSRVYSHFVIKPEGLSVQHQIDFEIARASTQNLAFSLPMETPSEISIKGIGATQVKESNTLLVDGRRNWKVLLASRQTGKCSLVINYIVPLPSEEPKNFKLPVAQAEGVVYQSGMIAVEGDQELDIAIPKHPRAADVGELVDSTLSIGQRLLGTYGYIGIESDTAIDIARRPGHALPTTIVEKGSFVTVLSANGRSYTVARYQLRSKDPFIEALLPNDAKLWTVLLDGHSTLPQRNKDRVLLEMDNKTMSVRDLQIVYEQPIDQARLRSTIRLAALQLLLPDATQRIEVPVADLQWEVRLPTGRRLVQSNGTLRPMETEEFDGWRQKVWRIVREWGGESRSWTSYDVQGGTLNSYVMDDAVYLPPTSASSIADTAARAPSQSALPKPATGEGRAEDPFGIDKVRSKEMAAKSETQALPQIAQPPAESGKDNSRDRFSGGLGRGSNRGDARQWALEGLRSLPFELDSKSLGVTRSFASLGDAPTLEFALLDTNKWSWLTWAIALVVFGFGLLLLNESPSVKVRYLLITVSIALIVPWVSPWYQETLEIADGVLLSLLGLVLFYLFAGSVVWFGSRWNRAISKTALQRAVAASAKGLLLCMMAGGIGSDLQAQAPIADLPVSVTNKPLTIEKFEDLLPFIQGLQPQASIRIPADAIVVPYDPSKPQPNRESEKILIPYATYVDLWNRVHPDRKLSIKAPPVPFAVRSVNYTTDLDQAESLVLKGKLEFELFVDEDVVIPLVLAQGVLTEATLDGSPAKLKVTGNSLLLHTSGKGRKTLQISVQFPLERQGGWRIVQGVIPVGPASQLDIPDPKIESEIRWMNGVAPNVSPERDVRQLAIGSDGVFSLQWRPKIAESSIDQGLTVESLALLDVQEDGIRMTWRADLEFRRGRRDVLRFQIPDGLLIERVIGGNIRSWKATQGDKVQLLDVTLLKAAVDREQVTFVLSQKGEASGKTTQYQVPVCTVPEAMLQQGTLLIRRSTLLDLLMDDMKGLVRADIPQDAIALAKGMDESPLPLRPFQAFRFGSVPFRLTLRSEPLPSKTEIELRSVLRLSPSETTLESQIIYRVSERPLYRAKIALPEGWNIEAPTMSGDFDWAVIVDQDKKQILDLQFHRGILGEFPIVVKAKRKSGLPATLANNPASFSVDLPSIVALAVDRQEGHFVVQTDPGYTVRSEELQGCESALMGSVERWLNGSQRSLLRTVLHTTSPSYSGKLIATPKKSIVSGLSISNAKVTDRAIEETVLIEWNILDAGLHQLTFTLPDWMKDARIKAPMLRRIAKSQVTIDGVGATQFTLELQDDVIGQFRVLIENDRPLVASKSQIAIPTSITGQVQQQFVVLENAGRDELLASDTKGLVKLDRQQAQYRVLANLLGGNAAEAYLVEENVRNPGLTFETKDRTTVQTAEARIGLAQTILAFDSNGSYRASQEYRIENRSEQYLEIEMPASAQIWTVLVANQPVKPVQVAPVDGGNGQESLSSNSKKGTRVRIPLVKTEAGDLDYGVVIKYGGKTEAPSSMKTIHFPLMRTINIHVELSQVRLMLPKSHRWYGFNGTMGQVNEQSDFTAGWLSYKTKQILELTDMVSNAKTSDFSKARATANLKQLESTIQGQAVEFQNESLGNKSLSIQLQQNSAALSKAQNQLQISDGEATSQVLTENRSRFNDLYAGQGGGRGRNLVNGFEDNFRTQEAKPTLGKNAINAEWFANNAFNAPVEVAGKKMDGRLLNEDSDRKVIADETKSLQNPTAVDLLSSNGSLKSKANPQKPGEPSQAPVQNDYRGQVRRYQEQLEGKSGQLAVGGMGGGQGAGAQGGRGLGGQMENRRSGMQTQQQFDNNFGANGIAPMPASTGQAPGFNPSVSSQPMPPADATRFSSGTLPPVVLGGTMMSNATPNFQQSNGLGNGFGMGGLNVDQPSAGFGNQGYLASLDVNLPQAGTEFLFTTPRGEIELNALSVDVDWIERVKGLGMAIGAVALLWIVVRFGGWILSKPNRRNVATLIAILASIVWLITGLLPVFALVACAVSVLFGLGNLAKVDRSDSLATR